MGYLTPRAAGRPRQAAQGCRVEAPARDELCAASPDCLRGACGAGGAGRWEPKADTLRAQVPGCCQSLQGPSHGKAYNVRYRLCELHLRAGSVHLASGAARWCQTCSRFHALAAFTAAKRTCDRQLEAGRRKRHGRAQALLQAARAPRPAPPQPQALLPEQALGEFLDGLDGGENYGALLGGELEEDLFEGTQFSSARLLPVQHRLPQHVCVSLKADVMPEELPDGVRDALCLWAGAEPLAMLGVAQPGCTLLTVDLLLRAPPQGDLRAALMRCGEGSDAFASATTTEGLVEDTPQAEGAWQPLSACLVLSAGSPDCAVVALKEAPGTRHPRCRMHGQLLPVQCQGRALTLTLPAGFTHGCALLDEQPVGAGAAHAPCPRALFLTTSAELAEELRQQPHPLLLLVGAAMQPRASAQLQCCAATLAAQRGLAHTLQLLLPSLSALTHEEQPSDLLAQAVSCGQPACVRALLRCQGAIGYPLTALHAAALMAASPHAQRAALGVACALDLTAQGGACLAWFTAAVELPGQEGKGMRWTAAAIARRGKHPACVALSAALQARVHGAQSALSAQLGALPATLPRPTALALLLASAPPPLPPLQHGVAADGALVDDLASAMLRGAVAAHATPLPPPPRLSLALMSLTTGGIFLLPVLASFLHTPMTRERLHEAMRAGPLHPSLLHQLYPVHLVYAPCVAIMAAQLLCALFASPAVVHALVRREHQVYSFTAVVFFTLHLLVHKAHWSRWKLHQAGAELVWQHSMGALQLLVTATICRRSVHLAHTVHTWALVFPLLRTAWLTIGLLAPLSHIVPYTQGRWFWLTLQLALLAAVLAKHWAHMRAGQALKRHKSA